MSTITENFKLGIHTDTMSNTETMNNTDKLKICKKYNDQLWSCIETNDYKVGNCGEYYYKFYRCFNSIY